MADPKSYTAKMDAMAEKFDEAHLAVQKMGDDAGVGGGLPAAAIKALELVAKQAQVLADRIRADRDKAKGKAKA